MSKKTPDCDCGHPKYQHIKTGVEYPPCRSQKCDCTGYSVSVNIQAKAVAAQAKSLPPVAPPSEDTE